MPETGKSRLKLHLCVRHTGSPQMARNRNVEFHRTFVRPACTISAEGNSNFTARLRVRYTIRRWREKSHVTESPHICASGMHYLRMLQRGPGITGDLRRGGSPRHIRTSLHVRSSDRGHTHTHTISAGGHLSMDTAGLPLPPKRKVKRTLKSRSSVEVQIQVDHQFL